MPSMRWNQIANSLSTLGIALIIILSFQLVGCQTPVTAKTELSEEKVKKVEADQNGMVIAAVENGEPERGLMIARQLLQTRKDDADLHNLQGLCYMALKNQVAAILSFRKAYSLESKTAFALNLSSALIENGDHDQALRLLEAMTKTKKSEEYIKKERIYHNIAYAYERTGKYPSSERWYRKALDSNPSYFLSHMGIARVFERTNRPSMARMAYTQASDFCAICFDPVEPLVKLYMNARQPREATSVITRFLRNSEVRSEDRARRSLRAAYQKDANHIPPPHYHKKPCNAGQEKPLAPPQAHRPAPPVRFVFPCLSP